MSLLSVSLPCPFGLSVFYVSDLSSLSLFHSLLDFPTICLPYAHVPFICLPYVHFTCLLYAHFPVNALLGGGGAERPISIKDEQNKAEA